MTPAEIREKRLAYPLSQDDLAARVGVTRQTIIAWECGTWAPRGANLAALERLFARRDGCTCACHGGSPQSRTGIPAWGEGELADLRRHVAAGRTPSETVELLTAEYGFRRSRLAIVDRANRLGLTFYVGHYSVREAARRLGVSRRQVDQWIGTGRLRATRHIGIGHGRPSRWWRIEAADLAAFAATAERQAI